MTDALNDAKQQLFLEVLRAYGGAKFAANGASMLPAQWPGDVLEVRRQGVAETLPGQVVLYEREGCFVAHRVVDKIRQKGRTLLVTRGDRLTQPDPPVSQDELLGRITAIQRGNRRIVPRSTFWSRMASWVLCRSEFCTRVVMHFSRPERARVM
jgi:hypothetical protein